jgi:hypothetical protein
MNELAMNSKNKNIRDLYRGINEFNLEITLWRMRWAICLQILTTF